MGITVKVKSRGDLSGLLSKIQAGMTAGMAIGGEMMAQAVEASANDMARYPTGELESTITYDPVSSGIVTEGKVVAGGDHAAPFAFGTEVHFVPYEEADERIIAGLYPHIKPVYADDVKVSGGIPANVPNNGRSHNSDRTPIGYLVSSSAHPFMEEGFTATKDTLVREIANQIINATGG